MILSLIAEATECDFKSEVENDKPLSWLKSVSAFANGIGGTLFFGVSDDGKIIGLDDIHTDGEAISRRIKDRMTPIPEFVLTPYAEDGKDVLVLVIKAGRTAPYYYSMDGNKRAFVRIGSESIPAPDHILNELILKGTNRTFDAISTEYRKDDYSFTLLEATYRQRTRKRFEATDYHSFGLANDDKFLTRAGSLLTDQHIVYNSRMFCTRWNGLKKGSIFDDALDDKEYEGNLIYLLGNGCDFIKNNTKVRFEKTVTGRIDKPDYSDLAVIEILVNALIHRDYLIIGSEIHIDIYDDRLEVSSPGGMFNGKVIQEQEIEKLKSERRNPIIADLFHRMRYMERRGSGLNKIVEETKKLPGYDDSFMPEFYSTVSSFTVRLKNVNYGTEQSTNRNEDGKSDGIKDGKRDGIKDGIDTDNGINETQKRILLLITQNPSITIEQISEAIQINKRNTEKNISVLRNAGLVIREGGRKTGRWIVAK